MKDLQDLELTRDYRVSIQRLWAAVTRPDQLVQWFGPEGVRFYTRLKTITTRWPSGVRTDPEFVMPTMG